MNADQFTPVVATTTTTPVNRQYEGFTGGTHARFLNTHYLGHHHRAFRDPSPPVHVGHEPLQHNEIAHV